MGEVDPAFIQDPKHRPKLSDTKAAANIDGVPLIDLSPISSLDAGDHDPRKIEGLVREIGKACEEWGFFQVINHGVAAETRRRLESVARKFFEQAAEEKRKVRRDEKSVLGYYDTELTKNVRDWKEVFDMAVVDPILVPSSPDPDDNDLLEWFSRWPDYPPEFREACEEYARETAKLAMKLMELTARSLGLPANKFKDYFKDQTSFMRLNHYPPCPFPHLALGVGRHKDSGCLTVLAQDDVGGLEVRRKFDGEWISVKPTPDAYIINVGDIIQVWSNDRYESVEHRVTVNSEKERFSIPFFFNPAHYTVVQPLEELIDEQNPPKFRAYNWGKFLVNRGLSNFKKLNVENIQTYHFRLQ
ncbi:Flavonol synthase/flavanone 3-hydroxylase [Morus notabilis]|uniref:Flavonol synthase/flavanone 3-hydroxylase n=1 Tax=Morus notabilis TaxID=981085 RepID=W9RBU0_9ROSA|nr:flavonol synthase/flavanone 3-hydroxylase [Morus notabilis]EXB63674.1 Flavonol synthase/flavanone 3-hydroxylase [Morus notabilis]